MRGLLAILLLSAMAGPASAQEDAPTRLTLTWENDLFAGTDRHYTNGVDVALAGESSAGLKWVVGGGQQIYTPRDTRLVGATRDERPYAGFAYVRLGLYRA